MRRALRVALIVAATLTITAALSVTAGPAYAGDLESCLLLWGEQYCRTHYTGRHIPTTGELRAAPRDCRTSWADRHHGCEGQA